MPLCRLVVCLILFTPLLAGCLGRGLLTESASPEVYRGQEPGENSLQLPMPEGTLPPAQPPQERLRPMWLREAIYQSLQSSDVIVTLSGKVQVGPTTTLDPLIAEAGIGAEVGKFNPKLAAGYTANQFNEPPNAFFGPGIATQTRYDETNFYASLTQPFATGGSASIAYAPPLAYIFFPQGVGAGQYNPAYSADLVFTLNQPLLRYGGRERNLTPIRIAQARTDQANWEVQSGLNSQIRSVSEAYWDLQAAYVALQAIKGVIPLAEESVRLEKARFELEQIIYADVARSQVQVQQLLRQQMAAGLEVRRKNYQLNQLIGINPTQADAIAPIDVPVQEKVETDIPTLISTAVENLPTLNEKRRQLDIRQMQLRVAQKDLLPDVNLTAQYRGSGLDQQLDSAIAQASTFNYASWTMGLNFSYPLGNVQARSRARAAELELTRDQLVLRRSEDQAGYNVAQLVAELDASWSRYESARQQLAEAQEWLKLSGIRYSNPLPRGNSGNWLLLALVDYQNAMRGYVNAVTTAALMLADYNKTLARLDEAQGISLKRWEILLVDGQPQMPPPSATDGPHPSKITQVGYDTAPKPAAINSESFAAMPVQIGPITNSEKSAPTWGHSVLGSYRTQVHPATNTHTENITHTGNINGHSIQDVRSSYRRGPYKPQHNFTTETRSQ